MKLNLLGLSIVTFISSAAFANLKGLPFNWNENKKVLTYVEEKDQEEKPAERKAKLQYLISKNTLVKRGKDWDSMTSTVCSGETEITVNASDMPPFITCPSEYDKKPITVSVPTYFVEAKLLTYDKNIIKKYGVVWLHIAPQKTGDTFPVDYPKSEYSLAFVDPDVKELGLFTQMPNPVSCWNEVPPKPVNPNEPTPSASQSNDGSQCEARWTETFEATVNLVEAE